MKKGTSKLYESLKNGQYMIKRKIDSYIEHYYRHTNKALLIDGAVKWVGLRKRPKRAFIYLKR